MRIVKLNKGVYRNRPLQMEDDKAAEHVANGHAVYLDEAGQPYGTKELRAEKPKRKRGRPKKVVEEEAPETVASED